MIICWGRIEFFKWFLFVVIIVYIGICYLIIVCMDCIIGFRRWILLVISYIITINLEQLFDSNEYS